jgi:glycosyltransferase involved in cell wall biosynthesis
MSAPILSICIPTCTRLGWLQKCLAATLPQVEALPEGLVEVVVSDNASVDQTWPTLQALAASHPCLRVRRNAENNLTENFNSVVQEAQGQYAWLMGDDDAPMPGAVARILAEVQEHPRDIYLLHATEVDLEERPVGRREWFRDLPKQDWDLRDAKVFATYLDHAIYMAGAFAFISVLVFNRAAWLEGLVESRPFVPLGWPHVAMGLQLARRGGRVRVLFETLVLNHVGNDPDAVNPWGRAMVDLRGWVRLADRFLADDPTLRTAFLGTLQRNRGEDFIAALRIAAPSEEAWEESRGLLLAAGYVPQKVAGVDLAHRALYQRALPVSPVLNPKQICFADLGFIVRGARRTAVLAPDAEDPVLLRLIQGLRAQSRGLMRVYCQEPVPADTPGLEWRGLDVASFHTDPAAQERVQADIAAFAPDLLVNADPSRHPSLDLVASFVLPAAAIAYPALASPLPANIRTWLDQRYQCLLPNSDPESMTAALGIQSPPEIASQAFLMDPDWNGAEWVEVLLSYLHAFQPGEPVALVFRLGAGALTEAEASQKILDIVSRSGRVSFPDVLVLDPEEDQGQELARFASQVPVPSGRGNVAGLEGPFGQRLAHSRLLMNGR